MITSDDTNFRASIRVWFLWIGWSGRPNTRNETSSTATATIALATTFNSVSGFICN